MNDPLPYIQLTHEEAEGLTELLSFLVAFEEYCKDADTHIL